MLGIKKFFRHFPSPLPLLFIAGGTIVVILYGRGYRPNPVDNTIKSTGLLSATSDPIGSQVYIDGQLKTATNNTLTIDPGWYSVTIAKEGFIPWQKKLRVQGEIVTKTDPFLFPTNPSLSPLTTVGIEHPTLSPDGTKIAYIIPIQSGQNGLVATKAGLWTYELVERPLGFNRDQRQVAISSDLFNFSGSKLLWSPDSSQIMVVKDETIRLYQTNKLDDFTNVTPTYLTILQTWKDEKDTLLKQKLAAFKQPIINTASESARIISFSPDESKILYEATASATITQVINPPMIGTNPSEESRTIEPGNLYVYDSREDKNYLVMHKEEVAKFHAFPPTPSASPKTTPVKPVNTAKNLPKSSPIEENTQNCPLEESILGNCDNLMSQLHWFPTSRHIVLTLAGKIDILEYDRTNWVTVYSGPFIDNFMAPWPNGSRIIVMTNLNPGVSSLPNLYTVNLR